ncbi:MAG: fructose-6-phosphate aldolase [Christensenellaceae bacterium]|nr:fructose-6-phosphate aldolase [Christensenellaceae bacterium]
MRYMIDTANVADIKAYMEFFPIDGVTTNPTLVAAEKADFIELITAIRDLLEPGMDFFIQLRGETAEEMVAEALKLHDYIGENYVAKIPMCKAGLKATRILTYEHGIPCCVTAICSRQQALLAARAGACYVAPYVNRLDNICGDGVDLVADVAAMLDHFELDCEVVAASFKNIQQIQNCAVNGCHVATIKPELFDGLISHPLTDSGIAGFDKDWKAVYGDKKILDFFAE